MPLKVELRDNGKVHLSGYVCAVGRDSRLLPPTKSDDNKEFYEMVEAGAFETALNNNKDVILKLNHKSIITSQSANDTFKLLEDNIGLYVDVETDNAEIIDNKDQLQGWSFGFSNPKDKWVVADDGHDKRILQGFDLVEISVLTTTPAYIGTSIEVRNFEDLGEKKEEVKTEEDTSSTSQSTDRYNYYAKKAQYLNLCRR